MNREFVIKAANSMKEKAAENERNGFAKNAANFYDIAARRFSDAAACDPANSLQWKAEAQTCEAAAKRMRAAAATAPRPDQTKPRGGAASETRQKGEEAAKAESKAESAAEAESEKPTLDEAMTKLNSLVGLGKVKKQVGDWVNQVKVFKKREERNLPVPAMSYHMVFTGNPGTGKTTVARIIADIYSALGIISKGQLVEVSRGDLVGEYIGHTAKKTGDVLDSAMGGVLFVDEAYSLVKEGNDFGQEAIDTILLAMENHRDDLVVIVAGYPDLMKGFIDSNPGLKSRFTHYIEFEDYDGDELYRIFMSLCDGDKYVLEPETEEKLKEYFKRYYETRDRNFGNARDVRNHFNEAVSAQCSRIAEIDDPTYEEMTLLRAEDMPFLGADE
ncbi:MAG: AAA family ATPase [Clostridia bacterium]|nr:AAA family ATPase [Clostridia bacterium]